MNRIFGVVDVPENSQLYGSQPNVTCSLQMKQLIDGK